MKKIVGISMVFLLLIFFAMPVYASDLVVTSGFVPQYKAIMQMSAGLCKSIQQWVVRHKVMGYIRRRVAGSQF